MPLSPSANINLMLFGCLMPPDGAYLSHTSLPSDGNCQLYHAGVLYTFYFAGYCSSSWRRCTLYVERKVQKILIFATFLHFLYIYMTKTTHPLPVLMNDSLWNTWR